MSISILGRIRKVLEAIDAVAQDGEEQLTLSPQQELLIAAGAAPYGNIVAPGRAFYTGTTTAVAGVVAIPTTAHLFSLYNNDADGGRSLVIDWVAASGVAKTAAAGQQQIIVNLGQLREATPTDAALVIKKANGLGVGASVDSKVRTLLTGTALPAATGVAGAWVPLGPSFGSPGAAATPGNGAWIGADGRFIVPPGRYFAMHVLADVVGSTFQGFIGWHERQIALG